jgi:hypothetical protein
VVAKILFLKERMRKLNRVARIVLIGLGVIAFAVGLVVARTRGNDQPRGKKFAAIGEPPESAFGNDIFDQQQLTPVSGKSPPSPPSFDELRRCLKDSEITVDNMDNLDIIRILQSAFVKAKGDEGVCRKESGVAYQALVREEVAEIKEGERNRPNTLDLFNNPRNAIMTEWERGKGRGCQSGSF